MTGLELIERGVRKDTLALLAIPLIPLEIILPFVISRYTTGAKPLSLFVKSHPFRYLFYFEIFSCIRFSPHPNRLLIGLVMALFVYLTPSFQNYDKTFPWYFYALAVALYSVHQIAVYNMFVSQMAFFAQVSDPKIGGTYMTLLNTLGNLGNSSMFRKITCQFVLFFHR